MFLYEYILVVVLVFTRIAAMFGVIPIFGAKNTPTITKIGLVFFISIIMVPMQLNNIDASIDTVLELGVIIIQEAIIGFSMGLIVLITMNVFYLTGSLIDRHIGFALVSVISAQDEAHMPVSANMYYIFALMIFLVTNVHHLLIKAIYDSYVMMPIGSAPMFRLIAFNYTEIMRNTFIIGFRMAAPFILTVLIANILLGLLSKAMPGMNVFMIGMPLKILVGLYLMYILMGLYPNFIVHIFEVMMEHIYRLIGVG